MFGGIHHVNNRTELFREVFRILKPGGRFYWREPANDFFLWRLLRFIIYKVSPQLDYETERPLRHQETCASLRQVGFRLKSWKTYGFLGFCLFMNSDVLVFNRLLAYLPAIRKIARLAAAFDRWTLRAPLLRGADLQVIGWAEKTRSA